MRSTMVWTRSGATQSSVSSIPTMSLPIFVYPISQAESLRKWLVCVCGNSHVRLSPRGGIMIHGFRSQGNGGRHWRRQKRLRVRTLSICSKGYLTKSNARCCLPIFNSKGPISLAIPNQDSILIRAWSRLVLTPLWPSCSRIESNPIWASHCPSVFCFHILPSKAFAASFIKCGWKRIVMAR